MLACTNDETLLRTATSRLYGAAVMHRQWKQLVQSNPDLAESYGERIASLEQMIATALPEQDDDAKQAIDWVMEALEKGESSTQEKEDIAWSALPSLIGPKLNDPRRFIIEFDKWSHQLSPRFELPAVEPQYVLLRESDCVTATDSVSGTKLKLESTDGQWLITELEFNRSMPSGGG